MGWLKDHMKQFESEQPEPEQPELPEGDEQALVAFAVYFDPTTGEFANLVTSDELGLVGPAERVELMKDALVGVSLILAQAVRDASEPCAMTSAIAPIPDREALEDEADGVLGIGEEPAKE